MGILEGLTPTRARCDNYCFGNGLPYSTTSDTCTLARVAHDPSETVILLETPMSFIRSHSSCCPQRVLRRMLGTNSPLLLVAAHIGWDTVRPPRPKGTVPHLADCVPRQCVSIRARSRTGRHFEEQQSNCVRKAVRVRGLLGHQTISVTVSIQACRKSTN